MMVGFFFFFLKMHEAWVNAPSLEHKSMSLKKTWVDQFLRTMMQVMIFLKTSVLDLSKCLSLIEKIFLSVKQS